VLYRINGFDFDAGRLISLKVNLYFGFGPKTFRGGSYKIIKYRALGTINMTYSRKLGPVAGCADITCFNTVPSTKFARAAIGGKKPRHLERDVNDS